MTRLPLFALALVLACALTGCSKSENAPDHPEYYDHGMRTPKPFDPAIVPSGPSHSLPLQNSGLDLLEISGEEIEINAAAGTVHASYAGEGKTIEQTWKFEKTWHVPTTVFGDATALQLTQIRVDTTDGTVLGLFDGETLAKLTGQSNQGVSVNIEGPGVFTVLHHTIPPLAAEPNLHYTATPLNMGHLAIGTTLDDLRSQASATPEYHQALLALVQNTESLTVEELKKLTDAVYFSDAARMGMERAQAELSRHTNASAQILRERVAKNILLAQSFGPLSNQILTAGILKLSDLSAESGLSLLTRAFPGAGAKSVFDAWTRSLAPPSPAQQLSVVEIAKSKSEYAWAATTAVDWFKHSSDGSSQALVALVQGFPEGPELDRLLIQASSELRTTTVEETALLVRKLDADAAIKDIAPRLIARAPDLTPQQLILIIEGIAVGVARDSVLGKAVATFKGTFTCAELAELLKRSYASATQLEVFDLAIDKVSDLSSAGIQRISTQMKTATNRDEILRRGNLKLKKS